MCDIFTNNEAITDLSSSLLQKKLQKREMRARGVKNK